MTEEVPDGTSATLTYWLLRLGDETHTLSAYPVWRRAEKHYILGEIIAERAPS
jgi:hypothetical protein